MKMKNLLLLLSALVVVPAWAADPAPAPAKPKPAAKQAASLSLGVAIELKGSSEDVSALVAKLKNAPVYKAAACEIVSESKIACAKADGALMVFLDKNAPGAVQWTIISNGGKPCPTGCQVMLCPPPNGPLVCCNPGTLKACQ